MSAAAAGAGHQVDTASGYRVPVTWYAGAPDTPTVVLLPALGVAARFYDKLAATLAGSGLNVAVMEQRGQGDSALRPGRGQNWGFAEVLDNDLPALLDWAEARRPGAPLYLMGHSLGGHFAAITAGRFAERIHGLILVATGSPWWKAFEGARARPDAKSVRRLIRLIPAAGLLFGYFPGERIGFGGNEARGVMNDWRTLAQHNRYQARGLDEDLDAAVAAYTGPVLAVRLADDALAPEASVQAVTDKFRNAPLRQQVITADQLGDRADHFRWARQARVVADLVTPFVAGPR